MYIPSRANLNAKLINLNISCPFCEREEDDLYILTLLVLNQSRP